ncbi:MAG: AmmeMemoRadiSam system protein A [Candidatus Micrarchaeota archaeon]|nr:AmmeMemoRadiSam system protein A [Candidatus Micrarchaeota archaeon]
MLADADKKYLLRLARSAIAAGVSGKTLEVPPPPSQALLEKRGVFVTLTEDGELRGCIGYIEPIKPIVQAVIDNAQNAAFEDPRFPPLTENELGRIKIEISILSPTEEIRVNGPSELISRIKPGVHGLIIQKGWASATFLPQVWEELPSHEQFLSNLCLKAGLGPEEWKRPGMRFFTYTVESFSE